MSLLEAGSKILFSRVVQVLANAAVVLIVAKILGPVGQGHYSLTMALLLLTASLLAGGAGLAAVPPLRQGLVPARRIVLAQGLWWAVVLAGILGLAAVSRLPGPARFLAENLGWERGLAFLLVPGAMGVLGFEVFSYDLLARGRLVVGALVNGVRATAHFLALGAVVLLGSLTFARAVTLASLAQFLGAVLVVVVLWRELRRPDAAIPKVELEAGGEAVAIPLPPVRPWPSSLPGLLGRLLREGWVGQLSAVAYFLLLRLDQAILLHYRDAAEVGIYSVGVYCGEMLWLLPGALTPLLVHSSADNLAASPKDLTALRAVRLGLGVTLAVAVPLYLVAGPLLSLLAGGAYAGSGAALRALLPGIVVFAPGAVLAGDFIGRGKPHWNTQASLGTVAVNVALAVWLVPTHGAVGAGWASSLAYLCGSAFMIGRFLRVTGIPASWLLRGPGAASRIT